MVEAPAVEAPVALLEVLHLLPPRVTRQKVRPITKSTRRLNKQGALLTPTITLDLAGPTSLFSCTTGQSGLLLWWDTIR